MSSINILCPNGRRQVIKVTPNKTILQVLEEVCQKRGFDPILHDLKHGRNTLDVGSTFRFSGVPNNGKLELVQREKARSLVSEITIALTLESGERRQRTMKADTTLADMVRTFQQNTENLLTDESPKQPVIINMREEIVGAEALEQLTLQSIGLISGRVALRLVHRIVADEVLAQISTDLRIKKQKQESKVAVGKVQPEVAVTKETRAVSQQPTQDNRKQSPEPMDVSAQAADVKSEVKSAAVDTSPTQLAEAAAAIVTADCSVAMQTLADSNQTTQVPASPAASQDNARTATPSANTQVVIQRYPLQPTAQIQHVVPEFKFPEATAGKDLYRNELSDVQSSDFLPCERDPVVFSLRESTVDRTTSSTDDIPDDFFEVTKADLQNMMRDLREQVTREESAPLMTSSMRQATLESKLDNYQHAVVRFYFHDQTVLQAKFRPRETVHSLTKFVQNHLKDKRRSFYLYTTPPKKVLNDPAATLLVAQLVPMAIVYVSSSVPSDACLSDETISCMATRLDADREAKISVPQRQPKPREGAVMKASEGASTSRGAAGTSRGAAGTSSVQSSGSRSNLSTTAASTARSDKHVPKWYKPSGK